MTGWSIRPALPDDAPAVAAVLTAARRANAATIPPWAHGPAQLRRWVGTVLLPEREVWVVDDETSVHRVIGVLALDAAWLDQLYVRPEYVGQGIGTALLDLTKVLRPGGFGLWVFVSNLAAQRFYERHGCVEVERTDGSDNEEQAPDIHYTWTPA